MKSIMENQNTNNNAMIEHDEKSRSRSRVSVGQIAIGTPSYTFKSKLTGAMAPTGAS